MRQLRRLLLLTLLSVLIFNKHNVYADSSETPGNITVEWGAYSPSYTPYLTKQFKTLREAFTALAENPQASDYMSATELAQVKAYAPPKVIFNTDTFVNESFVTNTNGNVEFVLNNHTVIIGREGYVSISDVEGADLIVTGDSGEDSAFIVLGSVENDLLINNAYVRCYEAVLFGTYITCYGGDIEFNSTNINTLFCSDMSDITGQRVYTSNGLDLTISGSTELPNLYYDVEVDSKNMLTLSGGYYKVDPNTYKTRGETDISSIITISGEVDRYTTQTDWAANTTNFPYRVHYTLPEKREVLAVGGTAHTAAEAEGTPVVVTANDPQDGYVFVNWTSSPSVTFDSATSPETFFLMGNANTTVIANFEERPRATMTTAPTAATPTYNGNPQSLLATPGVSNTGAVQYKLHDSDTWLDTIPTAINAGTYTVDYRAKSSSSYSSGATASLDVTVKPMQIKDPVITVNGGPFTYQGKAIKPTVTVKVGTWTMPPEEYALSYKNNNAPGTATIKVTSILNSNYSIDASVTFEIAEGEATYTAPKANDLTYNGKFQDLITAGKTDKGTMKYATSKDGEYSTDIPQGCDVGEYSVWYKIVDGTSTIGPFEVEGVVIAKAASLNVLYRTVEVPIGASIITPINLATYLESTASITEIKKGTDSTGALVIDKAEQPKSTLGIDITTTATAAGSANVTVTAESSNYSVVTITIPIASKAKTTEIYYSDSTGMTSATDISVNGLDTYTKSLSEDKARVIFDAQPRKESTIDSDKAAKFRTAIEAVYTNVSSSSITKEYFDFSIVKRTDSGDVTVADTESVVEIVVDYNLTDKFNLELFREHDGTVTAFKELPSKPTKPYTDGTFYADIENSRLYIYSELFSIYGITYTSSKSYKVQFDSQKGSAVSDIIVADGGTISTIPTPTKSGCEFLGWYTSTTGGEKLTTETKITSDITYYAHWTNDTRPKPTTPDAPTLKSKTSNSITVVTVIGQVYSIDNGATWKDTGTFTDLKPLTTYSIVTKISETATTQESDVSKALQVTTDTDVVPEGLIFDLSSLENEAADIPADLTLVVDIEDTAIYYNGKKHVSADTYLTKSGEKKRSNDVYLTYSDLPNILKLTFVYKNNVHASTSAYCYPKLKFNKNTPEFRKLPNKDYIQLKAAINSINREMKKKYNRLYFTILPVELYYAEQTSKKTQNSYIEFTDTFGGKLTLWLKKNKSVKYITYKYMRKTTSIADSQFKIKVTRKSNGSYHYEVKGTNKDFVGIAYGVIK